MNNYIEVIILQHHQEEFLNIARDHYCSCTETTTAADQQNNTCTYEVTFYDASGAMNLGRDLGYNEVAFTAKP